jgi:hypothetical protein
VTTVARRTLQLVQGVTKVARASARAARPDALTVEQAQDPSKVALVVSRIARGVVDVMRALDPPYINFKNVTCTSGTDVILNHGFGCEVHWWVVRWSGSAAPNLREDATKNTADRLVLDCGQTGTATIRVQAAG